MTTEEVNFILIILCSLSVFVICVLVKGIYKEDDEMEKELTESKNFINKVEKFKF